MPTEPVLIAGEWCSEPNAGSFSATNPKTREAGSLRYPVSGRATLERALAAATLAAGEPARTPPEAIARFLALCGEGIEARAEARLWAWYLEWSQIARTALDERKLLSVLGFGAAGRPKKKP